MKVHLHWEHSQFIPPARGKNIQPGLAGAIIGVTSNNLIIAGGSNFEDALPWRGGKKLYHDEIYMLHENGQATYSWTRTKTTLPFSLAYSGNVTISKGIVCVGGENESGPLDHAFLLSLEGETPSIKVFPNLPYVVSSPGTTAIESTVYVVGGLDNAGAISSFSAINLSQQNPKWKRLPDLPVALSHAVVVAQWNKNEECIYVIGGRAKKGSITEFLSSVWEYTPSLKCWKLVSQIQTKEHEVFKLSAGTGVALGHNQIIVFGGDKGIIYNQTEQMIAKIDSSKTDNEKQQLLQDKISLLENHPGFYNEVLIYHTDTQSFSSAGIIRGAIQVTTTAVIWNKKVFIPGGEIKPGIRTPEVKVVSIN
ncbi:MAG: galactose oxidase [Bacteroidetes bacterium]|nr:galactose oxidase [Bacteroidota bacterium]